MKKKKSQDELAKLMKVTELLKRDGVVVAPKSPPKGANKWRGKEPKFAAKAEGRTDLVDGGGMQVDPARKAEYDAWRADKLAEENERRAAKQRKYEAARLKRAQDAQQQPKIEG